MTKYESLREIARDPEQGGISPGVEMTVVNPKRPTSRFMTIQEVADDLATSKTQVIALIRSGDLLGIQVGGRKQWRVERSKLEEYIAEQYFRTQAGRGAAGI